MMNNVSQKMLNALNDYNKTVSSDFFTHDLVHFTDKTYRAKYSPDTGALVFTNDDDYGQPNGIWINFTYDQESNAYKMSKRGDYWVEPAFPDDNPDNITYYYETHATIDLFGGKLTPAKVKALFAADGIFAGFSVTVNAQEKRRL